MDNKTIHGLTALRGLAALGVTIFHYHLMISQIANDNTIINHLYLMVDLFFVLSGFIMLHVYGSWFRHAVSPSAYGVYMRARFARIYPVHLFTLGITIIISLIYFKVFNLSDSWYTNVVFEYDQIISHVFLINAMGTFFDATWNTPAWSISVEWWAYTLFPFIALLHGRFPRVSIFAICTFIVIGYYLLITHFSPLFWEERWQQLGIAAGTPYPRLTVDVITGSAFLRALLGMSIGILIYRMYSSKIWYQTLSSRYAAATVVIIYCLTLYSDLVVDPVHIVLMGILILSIAYRNEKNVILRTKSAVFLGEISYSLYLVHVPVILIITMIRRYIVPEDPLFKDVGFNFPAYITYPGLLIYILLIIVIAFLTNRFIEAPLRNRIKGGTHV